MTVYNIISFNADAAQPTSDEEQQHVLATEMETFADSQSSLDQTNKHKCPYCVYSCVKKSNMNRHIKQQHTHKDEKAFKCSKCHYATKNKAHLTRHMKTCKY